MDTILSLRRELEAVKREADRAIELEIKTSEKLDIAREALKMLSIEQMHGSANVKNYAKHTLEKIGGECQADKLQKQLDIARKAMLEAKTHLNMLYIKAKAPDAYMIKELKKALEQMGCEYE